LIVNVFNLKSIPIVGRNISLNVFSTNFKIREDLPTEELPARTILNK
jgi:hypothetical protein